jgi:hypothetical protein
MLIERNQVGKREALADLIARVDAKSKPLLAMIPKGPDTQNMLFSWQMDDFENDADLAVEDGEDASTFTNASPNRFLASTYMTKFRDTAMVSDLAENVSNVAGLPRGEEAESIMKKLEKVGRSIEAALCGDQEHQAGAAGVAYKTRGLGVWIQATPQALLPVDANYLTPAGSIDTTAMASVTTTIIDNLLQSSFQQTGKRQTFVGLVGPTLKRVFTALGTATVSAASAANIVRTYNTEFQHSIDNVVDMYNGDFGIVDLHPTLFNATTRFGGSDAASLRRGYFLLTDLLQLRHKRKPRVKELEDRGGGPRFLVDTIFGLEVKNPKAFIKMAATS